MGGHAASFRQRWALLGVILLAVLLRAYSLGQAELWFDEALSAVIAAKGWAGVVRYTLSTPFEHPPIYYVLLHSWTRVAGNSEFVLRFFSLFWGVLLVPLSYRFMASWGGRTFGLLAALVAALSTVHIDHSQSARMYTMLPVLGILLLSCFFRALATTRIRWWIGFFLVAIVGIGTHYYFALLFLVPLAFLLLCGPKYRRLLLLLLLIQVATALLFATWYGFSPGFRQAVQQVIAGEGGGISSLGQRIAHSAGGLVTETPLVGHLAIAGIAVLGAIVWPLPPASHAHPVSLVGSRRFVFLWVLVPWLVALAIPYWLQDRHLAYLWPALYALAASGLLVLRTWSKWLFLAALVVMGATTGYWLYRQDAEPRFEFGRIMAYIEDRALPDDLVVMNQPVFWPYVGYYAQRDLETIYLPANAPLSAEAVDRAMKSLVGERTRIWLGPVGAWTADPDLLVEQWLVNHAYQAQKEWFSGGGSAALYFTTDALERLALGPPVRWEDGIRLLAASSSSLLVSPGDAVRLSLTWQAEYPVDSSRLVYLFLTDAEGQTWASRQSEPCGGWCPTNDWEPGVFVQDQHALMIPPGTPPGVYRLYVALFAPEEGRELVAGGAGQRVGLGQVQVTEPGQAGMVAPNPLPQYPLQAEFGNQLSLLGFDLDRTKVQAGGPVDLALHWLAQAPIQDDYSLVLEVARPGNDVEVSWSRLLLSGKVPTSGWQAGQYLRGLHQLMLPGKLVSGDYQLRLKMLDANGQQVPYRTSRRGAGLGDLVPWLARSDGGVLELANLKVTEAPERPHNFELPEFENPVRFQLGQNVELVGYDLDTSSAMPGGQIELILYWQAWGATDKPYKVFTHLSEDALAPLAQHDGLPGEGCCPPDTWVKGEVVVDRHVIPLAADFAPGSYRLTAGMYDEPTGVRLPVTSSKADAEEETHIPIAEVVVRPRSTPMPTLPLPQLDHRIYLPLVEANW
jgi:mannosyltransferase